MQRDAERMSDPNMHYDGERWLRWDGSQWLDAASGTPVSGAPTPSSGNSRKALWLVMGGLGVLLVLGVIGIAVAGGSKPQATPTPTPSITIPTSSPSAEKLSLFAACETNLDVISNAATVLNGTPTAAQFADLKNQMKSAAANSPEPLQGKFEALTAMFDGPPANMNVDGFKAIAKGVVDACAAEVGADPTPTAPAGPATTIEEGDWTVGVDVAPGKYRTEGTVSGTCYWGIYKAGSNQSKIIDNGIATGGRPTVTLKKGQEFKNQGCGNFVKVG